MGARRTLRFLSGYCYGGEVSLVQQPLMMFITGYCNYGKGVENDTYSNDPMRSHQPRTRRRHYARLETTDPQPAAFERKSGGGFWFIKKPRNAGLPLLLVLSFFLPLFF